MSQTEAETSIKKLDPRTLRADNVINYNDQDATKQVTKFGGDARVVAGVIVCTVDVPTTEWRLKILRPRGVCVPLGLPPNGFKFIVRGSLVTTKPLVDEMPKLVDKHGARLNITTTNFKDVPKLPGMYNDEYLKGRLVMKM